MVRYWQTGDLARAKLVTLEDGAYGMLIEGEKHLLMGFPRGPVLFGPLARLKHLGKNLVFNQVWKMLEKGQTNEQAMNFIKAVAIPVLVQETEKSRYDMFPPEKMCFAVREIWRAMSVIEQKISDPIGRQQFKTLKEGITFFFQEDDAYRFRLQWVAKYLNPKHFARKIYRFFTRQPYSFRKEFEAVMDFLENAEVVPDMKGRIKLIKRILLSFLEDKEFGELIERFIWEADWKKLKLTKADTYYFRGKYFKVDYEKFDY